MIKHPYIQQYRILATNPYISIHTGCVTQLSCISASIIGIVWLEIIWFLVVLFWTEKQMYYNCMSNWPELNQCYFDRNVSVCNLWMGMYVNRTETQVQFIQPEYQYAVNHEQIISTFLLTNLSVVLAQPVISVVIYITNTHRFSR